MSQEASISELHYQLVAHHRRCGGDVLRGYGLCTRILEVRSPVRYTAWGADYLTDAGRMPSIFSWRRLSAAQRNAMRDPLGVPAPAPAEAWLSTAILLNSRQTSLTRFEYNAETWKQLGEGDPMVSTVTIDAPYNDIHIDDMRAGLGFKRTLPLNFERATGAQVDELTTALQGLIATVS